MGGKRRKIKRKKFVVKPWMVAALLAVTILAVLVPHFAWKRVAETGARVPKGYRHYMVDLSHHNPSDIQWDSLLVAIDGEGRTTRDLKRAKKIVPVHAVILKASEGEQHRDRNFGRWWEEAGKAGLSRGAYHFFRSSKNPQLQAANYIQRVQLTHRDLPPVLDIETVHAGCSRETLNERALEWLRTVEQAYGRRPIVYTSDAFAKDWLNPDILDHYPLWLARYNSAPPRYAPWKWWQFTEGAVVYGIPQYVDLSVENLE